MRAIQQTIKHWEHIFPYAHTPSNEAEYEKLLVFADELMDWSRHHHDQKTVSLLKLLANNIQAYETKHFPLKKISPTDMLKFLMDEHALGQTDFPEIGS